MILDVEIDYYGKKFVVKHGGRIRIRTFDDNLYEFFPYELPEIFKDKLVELSIVYEIDCVGLDKISFMSEIDKDIVFKQRWYTYARCRRVGLGMFFANFKRLEEFLINTSK